MRREASCGYQVAGDRLGCQFEGWWSGRCYWHDKQDHGVEVAPDRRGTRGPWIPADVFFTAAEPPDVEPELARGIRYVVGIGSDRHELSV